MKPYSKLSRSRSKSSGFTLVELMVVIVIVVVLATLVFLGANRLRKVTNKAVSTENLRKLQLANGLYAADNNGQFVSTFVQDDQGKVTLWDRNPKFLDLYLGPNQPREGNNQESRVEPKDLDPIAYKAQGKGYDTLKANYGMIVKTGKRYKGGNRNVDSSYRSTQMLTPALTASFVTAVNWLVQYPGHRGWDGVEGKINATRIAYRHSGKALVAFYDGHVEAFTMEDLAELDRRGGQNNSFWNGTNGQR